jgi:murein DD-endopeptidase MepM/ murein hydrolase activator NlpD
MGPIISGNCSRFVLRLALAVSSAGALAGCASSERLAEAFDNPFQSQASAARPAPAQTSAPAALTAPVKAVQSRPLGTPVAPEVPSHQSAAKPSVVARAGSPTSFAGWTAEGGTPITVAPSDSAETLARRYGIPVEALVRTNGFASATEVQPGSRLVVPVYSASLAAANATKPAGTQIAEPVHPVPGGAKAPVPPIKYAAAAQAPQRPATIAAPVGTAPKPASALPGPPKAVVAAPAVGAASGRFGTARQEPAVKVGEGPVVIKPQESMVAVNRKPELLKKVTGSTRPETVQAQPQPQATKSPPATRAEAPKPAKVETALHVEPKRPVQDSPQEPAQEAIKVNVVSEAANPEFRWPAHGRIIQGFKHGGNDGINIAVPEGTSVKAAENGVVAYAGELKGYGNLVMIRHPNGFVSAYANNGGIEVKRGDNVKRGQVIARSGQSGDVSTPQLHFELRKGSTPVDPTQYLAGL